MAWGKEWITLAFTPKPEWLNDVTDIKQTIIYPATTEWPAIKFDGMVTVDLDKNGNLTEEAKQLIIEDIKEKVYNNLPPTHDPYANPNAHIYYQCACGAILDPGTKSFASLNNAAMNAGWKVRWGSMAYEPYCVECGESVE